MHMNVSGISGSGGPFSFEKLPPNLLQQIETLEQIFATGNPDNPGPEFAQFTTVFSSLTKAFSKLNMDHQQMKLYDQFLNFYRPFGTGGMEDFVLAQYDFQHGNTKIIQAFNAANEAMKELIKSFS